MAKKKFYSFLAKRQVDAELPQSMKDAMAICGWNAFGVYELVNEVLRKEMHHTKREEDPNEQS